MWSDFQVWRFIGQPIIHWNHDALKRVGDGIQITAKGPWNLKPPPEYGYAPIDPYSLCPKSHGSKTRQPNVKFAEYDADFQGWVAPFVMAAANVRIVHRTNALARGAYGKDFRYDEAVLGGRGLRGRATATAIAAGLGSFAVAASIPPLRAALERFVLPAPGEGPSPEKQKKGFYDLRFVGLTHDGRTIRVKVTGQGDPDYDSTSHILGQASAMLALDVPRSLPCLQCGSARVVQGSVTSSDTWDSIPPNSLHSVGHARAPTPTNTSPSARRQVG